MWLFYYFDFERNYDVLKSKSPRILLNKNINFNKNETEWKMENPTHSFREMNLVVCERKKKTFFVPFILSEGNSFNICVLYQCIMY